MVIRPSGRSTDFISPSFIYECGFQCSYCYVKRHNQTEITIGTNVMEMLSEVNNHAMFETISKPNQTHDVYVTYDIGCNSDIALHAKNIQWKTIFEFFKNHPIAMGSFATKYVNKNLLDFNPNKKIRIRFSLMPEPYMQLLEPNTSSITQRLEAVKLFLDAGYDVHLNFSPVIVQEDWLMQYRILFTQVNEYAKVNGWNNDSVKAEVIFLTHNENKHRNNLLNKVPGEYLLWNPSIQESKVSEYGGKNIRYEHNKKRNYIQKFINLHDEIIPWNTIRYIF